MLEEGKGNSEIAQTLRISPYRLNDFLAQARRFELSRATLFLEELWRLDWNLKTGAADQAIALESFVVGCGKP